MDLLFCDISLINKCKIFEKWIFIKDFYSIKILIGQVNKIYLFWNDEKSLLNENHYTIHHSVPSPSLFYLYVPVSFFAFVLAPPALLFDAETAFLTKKIISEEEMGYSQAWVSWEL